jgi:single-strand DNA-binding protein
MNKQFLIGNVCGDADLKSTPAGVTVCSFVVASDRRFRDAHGEKVTDFFRVQAWRQLGDVCGKYVKKGMKVAVIGELQARTYTAKDGSTRMSLDVNADEVEFMSKADEKPAEKRQMTPADPSTFEDITSDDVPF